MKKSLLFFLFSSCIYGQVGIGTITPNAALEINSALSSPSTHKAGLLPPVVSLTAINSNATTTAGVNVVNPNGGGNPASGTIVYNTNTSAVGANQVTPGYYFYNGTIWEKITSGTNKNWELTGNTGTTAGTSFIGTTDAQALEFRTNSNFAATIGATGRVGIGNTDQAFAQTFSFSDKVGVDALVGYSSISGGTGVYANSIGPNGYGVWGVNDDPDGIGVLGMNSEGIGVYGVTSGANGIGTVGIGDGANGLGVYGQSTDINGIAVFGYVDGANGRAINGQSSGTNGIGVFGSSGAGTNGRGVYGQSTGDNGTGVFGATNKDGAGANTPTAIYGTSAGAGSIGVFGATSGATSTKSAFGIYGSVNNATTNGNTDAAAIAGINSNATQGLGYAGPTVASTQSAIVGVSGSVSSKRTNAADQSYYFGVMGELLIDSNVSGAKIQRRSGGVIGIGAIGVWGSSGYRNSGGNDYGIYATSALTIGTGRLSNQNGMEASGIGIGVNGGVMGGFVNGQQYGFVSKGRLFGAYIMGNTFTNKPITQIETIDNQRVVSYVTTSATVDITTRGKGQLTNGSGFVSFEDSFIQSAELNDESLNITITATGNTNGIFIEQITNNGFYVRENMNGNHTVAFNWTAVSIRKGYTNGIEISSEILDSNWENNMSEVMYNENNTTGQAQPIFFDGSKISFSEITNQSNFSYSKPENTLAPRHTAKEDTEEVQPKKLKIKDRSQKEVK